MSVASVIGAKQDLLWPTYDRQEVLFRRDCGVYLGDSGDKRYLEEAHAHA
jgi:hypothetical protein